VSRIFTVFIPQAAKDDQSALRPELDCVEIMVCLGRAADREGKEGYLSRHRIDDGTRYATAPAAPLGQHVMASKV
jgi:hypothetical protein